MFSSIKSKDCAGKSRECRPNLQKREGNKALTGCKKAGACAFQKTFFGLDTDFLFFSLLDRGGERSGQIVGELVHRGTLKRFETNHSPFATRCQF